MTTIPLARVIDVAAFCITGLLLPVKRNLIHLDKTCMILTSLAKLETSCQEHKDQRYFVNLDKILARF